MSDIHQFHKKFYLLSNKIYQDNYLLKYCLPKSVIRRRGNSETDSNKRKKKSLSITYNVRKTTTMTTVPVCRNTFLDILHINKMRVIGVTKRYFDSGTPPIEKRGGDRKQIKFADRKNAVIEFIKKLIPLEIHYCRSKIKSRQYLSSELNISKLSQMFNAQALSDCIVKASYFRKIFNSEFNIGFGTPRTDQCSKCLELGEKIKYEVDTSTKNNLIIEKRVHKIRAKTFFTMLQEEKEGMATISFDCQKNQPLPKVADQAAYYSRQLYTYNFTAVIGTSHSKLTNVHIYAWTEDQYAKGSNEIASSLFHLLSKINFDGINTIRLMADGCGGQNKNSVLIGMCMKWLVNRGDAVKRIEIIFPVPGHSFLPSDRVFAGIEKKIKKKEIIVNPEEYYNIFKEHGKVYKLGTDVKVLDWKSAVQEVLKPPGKWHFKFAPSKRFILTKKPSGVITVAGEAHYRVNLCSSKKIFKTNLSAVQINPKELNCGTNVKMAKIKDVENLLNKHYGSNWRALGCLQYYKNVIEKFEENQRESENIENVEDSEVDCEPIVEINDLVI